MKQIIHKLILLFLSVVLLTGGLSTVQVSAEEPEEIQASYTYINPLYAQDGETADIQSGESVLSDAEVQDSSQAVDPSGLVEGTAVITEAREADGKPGKCTETVEKAEADSGHVYAIRTITDTQRNWGDLVFFRSNTLYEKSYDWVDAVDIHGNEYSGFIYARDDEIESDRCDYPNGKAPWYPARNAVMRVYVAPNTTVKVRNFEGWFYGFMELEEFDGTGFDTSECRIFSNLFFDCQKLKKANVKVLDTSSLRDLAGMFWRCKELTEIDLSTFKTDNCNSMNSLFWYCAALRSIDISSFNTASVSGKMASMFTNSNNIREIKLGPKFTVWTNDACLPAGTWTNGKVTKTEKELYEEYPSHAAEWAGTWVKIKDPVHVKSISLNKTTLSLKENQSETLKAALSPANADNQTVLWSSSNEAIASVDENGKVTANAIGQAVITATAQDGNHKAACTVTVTEGYHRYSEPEYTWSKDNKTVTARAVCSVCKEELKETVNTVYEILKEPTQNERGKGRYTAVFANELFQTQIKEVEIPSLSEITVTLNTHEAVILFDQTLRLNAVVSPSTYSDTLIWSSEDETIAAVDQKGNVKGIKPGKTYITVSTGNGRSDTCEIRVLFTDVADITQYFYNPVYWAVDHGITVGAGGAGKFSPQASCTREQIVTFLWRLMGEPEPESYQSFTDVKPTDWFYKPISWAASKGITVGLNDGTGRFGVGQPCTREQCVTFLHRTAGKPAVGTHQEFTDVTSDRYYYDAISWAASKGITVGLNDGTGRFGVGQKCTRAMIVTFLHRFDQNK